MKKVWELLCIDVLVLKCMMSALMNFLHHRHVVDAYPAIMKEDIVLLYRSKGTSRILKSDVY